MDSQPQQQKPRSVVTPLLMGLLLTLFLIVAGAVGFFVFIFRQAGVPRPLELLSKPKAQPVHFAQEIAANNGWEYKYDIPAEFVPGRLICNWTSRGKSAGIHGAMDDSLVFFKLIGPNNEVLQNLNHPVEGNVSVQVKAAGRYTFLFDNRGVLRSSPRKVELNGTYQAD